MKISELQDYIKEEYLKDFDDIESLVIRLVYDGKINSFLPILNAYIAKMENDKYYTKCELTETASLLHLRTLGVTIPNQQDRELHMMSRHSTLSCKKEKEELSYNESESEKRFKEIYNLK